MKMSSKSVGSHFAIAAVIAFCLASTSYSQQTAPSEISGVYISADKRHLGLSKFDQLPFTDRQKGDPDRYRALNPNFIQIDNGHYYFLLSVEPGTHYYDDEGLTAKGTLIDMNVAVELSRTLAGKDREGRSASYVYVKDKGYVIRKALPPADTIRTGQWFEFPIKSGPCPLYDGTGIVRGTLAVHSVRLNYGQQKEINGERCYYAFSTSITLEGTKEKKSASGWIPASAIKDGNDPKYATEVVTKMQPSPTNGPFTDYEITGGDPQERVGNDANGRPIYKYGYLDDKNQFAAYKVLPGVALNGRASIAATDYLKRNDDVINLGFNVAGVSNDTYRVSTPSRPLLFHRSPDKDATATIDLFFPKDDTHDGLQPAAKMIFVYGYVEEPKGQRWGWIPLGALKPKS